MKDLNLKIYTIPNFTTQNDYMDEQNRGSLIITLENIARDIDENFATTASAEALKVGFESDASYYAAKAVDDNENNFYNAVETFFDNWLENAWWCDRYEVDTEIIGNTGVIAFTTLGDFK